VRKKQVGLELEAVFSTRHQKQIYLVLQRKIQSKNNYLWLTTLTLLIILKVYLVSL